MEFQRLLRRRRMARNFDPRPIPPDLLTRVLENALRAPSAGFTQGTDFLVFEGPEEVSRYWDAVLPTERRARFPWPGLLQAPILIAVLSHRQAYLDRYAEADKRGSGFHSGDWTTPYWHVDAAFAALLILLTAVDLGLGALFFNVADIPAFRASFGVPDSRHPIGAIALGYPLPERPSTSLRRGRRTIHDAVHRGRW